MMSLSFLIRVKSSRMTFFWKMMLMPNKRHKSKLYFITITGAEVTCFLLKPTTLVTSWDRPITSIHPKNYWLSPSTSAIISMKTLKSLRVTILMSWPVNLHRSTSWMRSWLSCWPRRSRRTLSRWWLSERPPVLTTWTTTARKLATQKARLPHAFNNSICNRIKYRSKMKKKMKS